MHWESYLCTGILISVLESIFVHWKIYLCTENIFLHWETYLCTEKHICALKIYICALKNMSVMCSDQYICTEIFICALHIWATVGISSEYIYKEKKTHTQRKKTKKTENNFNA